VQEDGSKRTGKIRREKSKMKGVRDPKDRERLRKNQADVLVR
jgi:hypothetical protein